MTLTGEAVLVGLFGLVALAGSPRADAAQSGGADAHPSRPPGVQWFEGSVADAFTQAGASHKPVFLYWGAVWCPPCQELKATIFRRQDFLDRLTMFVPVYLDGDGAGAQAWGERFHVSGYPTVLVLREDQSEVERVSGGMDLARYAEVLELALGDLRPVSEVLAAVVANPASASETDCRRLAYNAWGLEDTWLFHPESLAPMAQDLDRAADRCPARLRVERARLQIGAVDAAVDAESKALEAGAPPSKELRELLARIPPILADRSLALATGDALQGLRSAYFTAAVQADPRQRTGLRTAWFRVMDAMAVDTRYSAADRLDALGSKLIAAKALDPKGKISPDLARDARRRIDQLLAAEHEPYARASLVNSALNALDTLGDDDRAHSILEGEIRTAASPYYYMSDFAELEEKRGHRDVAIEWLARSYRTAQGPATRFQWGANYVRGLVRMEPQDEAAIRDATLEILADLGAAGDLHGRTRRVFGRLDKSLREWNKDAAHEAALAPVRERVHAICGRMPESDSARPDCEGFLAPKT